MKGIILIIAVVMLLSSAALDTIINEAAKKTDRILADKIKALYLTPEEIARLK